MNNLNNINNYSYNFLIWDNPSNLPFPEEMVGIIKDVKWGEYLWNSSGFPSNGATYSLLNGKTLYQETNSSGEAKVEKLDFSGDIYLASYFLNSEILNNKDINVEDLSNFLVTFKATLLKGELVDVSLFNFQKQPYQEYQATLNKYSENLKTIVNREKTFWYKYLYFPYRFCVRATSMCIIYSLLWIKEKLSKFALYITPY